MRNLALLSTALAIAGCSTMSASNDVLGTADLRMANGQSAGTATLVDAGEALTLDVAVTGVPSGAKGFHLHTTGRCDAPDFQSAGGHLNPLNRDHGLGAPQGAHLGDLPNLQVDASGTTRTRIALSGTPAELLPYLFDGDGTSVMIHAQADDYVTDPSGNSGSRIVCGVLQRVP